MSSHELYYELCTGLESTGQSTVAPGFLVTGFWSKSTASTKSTKSIHDSVYGASCLHGLRAIASCCWKLEGLNILGISLCKVGAGYMWL